MTTEETILQAARKVFQQKGFAAARMDDIANEAGINRALLHYYYRNKEKMFQLVFEEGFRAFFSGVISIITADETIFQKITRLVSYELDMLTNTPELPLFILGELNRDPQALLNRMRNAGFAPEKMVVALNQQLKKEYEAGIIKKIDAASLIMNIMGLCIYPFVARPILKAVAGIDEEALLPVLHARKQELTDFIISGIKP